MAHVYHLTKSQRKKTNSLFALYMVMIGLSGPLMTIPQFMNVWVDQSVAGLSLFSWSAYTVGAASWLVYGFVHKEKPIIISQLFMFPLDLLIVIGILVYN